MAYEVAVTHRARCVHWLLELQRYSSPWAYAIFFVKFFRMHVRTVSVSTPKARYVLPEAGRLNGLELSSAATERCCVVGGRTDMRDGGNEPENSHRCCSESQTAGE